MLKSQIRKLIVEMAFLFVPVVLSVLNANDIYIEALEDQIVNNEIMVLPQLIELPDVCTFVNEDFPNESLSAKEKTALIFMREEEKLARDIYIKMFEKWDAQPFDNMRQAEERHMAAILSLINKYELEDPVNNEPVGKFQNRELADMYKTLMEKGNISLGEAFSVAAMIEVWDIADLKSYAKDINNEDILAVWDELERCSRNHLRACDRNLRGLGLSFSPESVNQALYDEIINSETERGGTLCANLGLNPGDGAKNKSNKGFKGKIPLCKSKKERGNKNRPCAGNQYWQGVENRPCAGGAQGRNKNKQGKSK